MTTKIKSSTFFTNNNSIDKTKTVKLNYENGNVSNISHDSNSITASFYSSSVPNLVYIDGEKTYNCKADKIYFTNTYHSISGINIDGELIIHHEATCSSGCSSSGHVFIDIYTVFPLRQSSIEPKNDLDNIMMNMKINDSTLELNKLIKNDLCIQYESILLNVNSKSPPNSIVLLFTTPLIVTTIPTINFDLNTIMNITSEKYKLVNSTTIINENFSSIFDDRDIFNNISSRKYKLGNANISINEGFTEGLESQDVNNMLSNMECDWIPYDMSGNQDIVKTYLIESTFFTDKTTNDAIVMIKYFVFFVFFIFIIYVFVPIFYIFFALRSIVEFGDTAKNLRLVGGMEVFFNTFILFFAILFLVLSQTKNDSSRIYSIVGFFILIFWMISYVLVEIQKYTTPLLTPFISEGEKFSPGDMPRLSERVSAVFDIIPNLMKNLAKSAENAGNR